MIVFFFFKLSNFLCPTWPDALLPPNGIKSQIFVVDTIVTEQRNKRISRLCSKLSVDLKSIRTSEVFKEPLLNLQDDRVSHLLGPDRRCHFSGFRRPSRHVIDGKVPLQDRCGRDVQLQHQRDRQKLRRFDFPRGR